MVLIAAASCGARTGPQLTLESSDAALRLELNGAVRRWALSGAAAVDHKAGAGAVEKQEAAALLAGWPSLEGGGGPRGGGPHRGEQR
jgi:hypothetical protein